MKRYRRRPRTEQKSPTKRRAAIVAGAVATACGAWWLLGDTASGERARREARVEDDQRYVIEERSWSDLVAAAPVAVPDEDPEEAERERYRAQQWENLDIAVSGDR